MALIAKWLYCKVTVECVQPVILFSRPETVAFTIKFTSGIHNLKDKPVK